MNRELQNLLNRAAAALETPDDLTERDRDNLIEDLVEAAGGPVYRDDPKPPTEKPVFEECGCCDHYHPPAFAGDCRDDANRFTAQQLDDRYGADGWVPDDLEDHRDDFVPGDPNGPCTNPGGHRFVCSGTEYGGDDESYHGEGRSYCIYCGADGDA